MSGHRPFSEIRRTITNKPAERLQQRLAGRAINDPGADRDITDLQDALDIASSLSINELNAALAAAYEDGYDTATLEAANERHDQTMLIEGEHRATVERIRAAVDGSPTHSISRATMRRILDTERDR